MPGYGNDQFLEGRVALITGSSRGIGRAIALELAVRGADIVVNYLRKRSAAAEVVANIEAQGRRAIAIKANLGDADHIETMFERVRSEFGRCDIIDVKETLMEAAERTPARRVTTPEDVADVVAFLCSDAAEMIIGQTIVVDGGWSILA